VTIQPYVDAHIHFWDPTMLRYSWLETVPELFRPMLPGDFAEPMGTAEVEKFVFVEGNPRFDQGVDEALMIETMAAGDPRIAGIVAQVDITASGRDAAFDRLLDVSRVRGIRHNIQGNPSGFCLQASYVAGVTEVGRRGLTFDLCATHDQLGEVVKLVEQAPETHFVLDHCGKPPIASGEMDPWRRHVAALAGHENVWCKLSGLLTEAGPTEPRVDHILPYVQYVTDVFGAGRLMYGTDWPVVTLAGSASEWLGFILGFTRDWNYDDRSALFYDNAAKFYKL
jgi:L-fuconolactonase